MVVTLRMRVRRSFGRTSGDRGGDDPGGRVGDGDRGHGRVPLGAVPKAAVLRMTRWMSLPAVMVFPATRPHRDRDPGAWVVEAVEKQKLAEEILTSAGGQ